MPSTRRLRVAALIVLSALAMVCCSGAQPVAKTSTPRTRGTKPDYDSVSKSVIDRMLAERARRGLPTIPGYKLVREAEEAIERQERILRVLKARIRTAQATRQYGRLQCLKGNHSALRRIHDKAKADTVGIELALRRSDRARAEELWLRVRVADMQAREHIHKKCDDTVHVEVEMTAPGGVRRFGSGTRKGQRGSEK